MTDKTLSDLDGLVEELRSAFNVGTAGTLQDRRREWVLRRSSIFSAFADLALELVRNFSDWRMLFIERDACPIRHLAETEAQHVGNKIDAVNLPITRKLLPERLSRSLRDVGSDRHTFTRRKSLIEQFVADEAKMPTLLHQLILEAADGAPRVVVVDTAYWGTVPLYVNAVLAKLRPEVATEWRLVIGPPGAPCKRNDDPAVDGEEGNALKIEMLSHPYELESNICRDAATGKLYVDRVELPHFQEQYAGELQALEVLLSQRREARP